MIKDFLQFIKKTILAINLSQQGLFAPLSKLQTFRYAKIPAQFFSLKKSDSFSISQTLINMAQELLTAAPLCGFPLYFLPCSEKSKYQNQVAISLATENYSKQFYCRLFAEICNKDFYQAKGLYETWQKMQAVQNDMRLYASLLEEVNKSAEIYEVDWIRTSQKTLVLNFKQEAEITDKLTVQAQKNLALHFAELFFTEKTLVEAWQGVLCTSDNRIAFLPILNIQKIDLADINFAIEHLQNDAKAQNLLQSKIIYAFALLKKYCPQIILI